MADSSLPPRSAGSVEVIPKGHNSVKWRLITHLPYPPGHSVNDGINRSLYSLQYTTIEVVASEAASLGPSALITKADIESAYHLVPVHPNDCPFLGLREGDKQIHLSNATIWVLLGIKYCHHSSRLAGMVID